MPVFRMANGTPVLATSPKGSAAPLYIEAYHLAKLLGYSQQHSIRKQVLADWEDIFEEGVDYEIIHNETFLRGYELLHEKFIGPIKPMARERGRMFISPPGLRKVFRHTSKECAELREALVPVLREKTIRTSAPAADIDETEDAGTEAQLDAPERQRQYEILERLLDHLRHVEDPNLRRLALMSAELGLGRQLDDIRTFLDLEPPKKQKLEGATHDKRAIVVTSPVPPPVIEDRDQAAKEYLAKRPFTQGAFFPSVPNICYGLKQIGEKAGGYSALQAGRAADIVASRMGYTHQQIRQKKLPFNELPELPDTTSGKLRKMYRFNSQFANHVIHELRTNPNFEPGRPQDLGPFGQGGADLPKLSKGPFDD